MSGPVSHVLIIASPDSELAEALSRAVMNIGGSPVRVSNPEDALRMVERAQPDVVAIEVGRDPTAEALTVIRRLRALTTLPIVAVADSDDGTTLIPALEAGADDYLTHIPISARLLEARLAALRRRARRSDSTEESKLR